MYSVKVEINIPRLLLHAWQSRFWNRVHERVSDRSIINALKRTPRTRRHLDASMSINGKWEGTSGNKQMVIDRLAELVDGLRRYGDR